MCNHCIYRDGNSILWRQNHIRLSSLPVQCRTKLKELQNTIYNVLYNSVLHDCTSFQYTREVKEAREKLEDFQQIHLRNVYCHVTSHPFRFSWSLNLVSSRDFRFSKKRDVATATSCTTFATLCAMRLATIARCTPISNHFKIFSFLPVPHFVQACKFSKWVHTFNIFIRQVSC